MKKGRIADKAQITVFVVIAIIIVAAVVGFFIFKDRIFPPNIPTEIAPVYNYYLSCLQQDAKDGASILGTRGGYIYAPDFEPGSEYSPFSSQLGFMGQGVPYWYYISANGVIKEQMPSLSIMNEQLGQYLSEKSSQCDFSSFVNQGYNIELGNTSSMRATIEDNKISIYANQRIKISKGETIIIISSHRTEIESNIGRFYGIAKKIYATEKSSMFLENYSRDVLYTYAPVSGTELNCSPHIWNPYNVIDTLKSALEANIGAIKINGNYYTLAGKSAGYFVAGKGDLEVDNAQVSFSYSRNWPSRFEVWPTENNLMVANPIGTQPGLSALGFCYAPYKFVYDMYFPVMIQVYSLDAEEIFQFPFAVVINKNVQREAQESQSINSSESICDQANTDITITTYNANLESMGAELKFRCLSSSCNIGNTEIDNSSGLASLTARVPQCVNGILIASSDGYRDKRYIISTNEETSAEIIMDKEYNLPLEIYVDGSLTSNNAVLLISENSDNITNYGDSVNYPNAKEIKLTQGDYSFDLKVFRQGSVNIPAMTKKQCFKVPKTGILGFFGVEEEKCYDIDISSQSVSSLPYAGGKINQYLTSSELDNAKIIRIYATSVALPSSIESIQSSYDSIESKSINMEIVN